MRYLLENSLLFDDQQGTLEGVQSGISAKLPYAAVLLLKVFCDNSQIMLARNDLMDRAWTENGLRASGSNLYNSLSLIRKTVESVGVDLKIIRTQPKVGMIMEATVTLLDEPEPAPERVEQTMDTQPEDEPQYARAGAQETPGEFHPAALTENPTESTSVFPAENSSDAESLHLAAESAERNIPNGQRKEALPVNNITAAGQRLSTLRKLRGNFYFSWSVFILIAAIVGQGVIFYTSSTPKFSPQAFSEMGRYQQCSLFRLDDISDVFPGKPVNEKISLMAKDFNIDCNNTRVNFYVDSKSNTHNTYSNAYQMNVVCIMNQSSHGAINCSNDYLQKRRG